MSIATTADLEIAPSRPLLIPLVSATACVALADWLFYGWEIGISLAFFLGVLGLVAVAGHRERATRKIQIIMAAIFIAGLLALAENGNDLSLIVGTQTTAMFVYVLTAALNLRKCRDQALSQHPENWRTWSFRAWRLQRYLANNPDIPSAFSNSGQGS